MVFLKNRHSRILTALFLFSAAVWRFSPAQTSEYELKAALLYNLTQFVSWPQSAFPSSDSPFQLCVAGEDPFGKTLDDVVLGEKAEGHPIVVRRMQDSSNADRCHIIYIPSNSEITVPVLLQRVDRKPVLLVGDGADFVSRGGTIALELNNRRIRMNINLNAARAAKLNISSKLLRLSNVVGAEQ